MSTPLSSAEIRAGLTGRAPKPFNKLGQRIELLMDNDRLCRGTIAAAGKRVALVEADLIVPDKGEPYRRVLIIVYTMVSKWRTPVNDAPPGNWMPGAPGYDEEMAR